MIVRQPRYSKKEFAKAGDEIYESQAKFLHKLRLLSGEMLVTIYSGFIPPSISAWLRPSSTLSSSITT